jgi:hypothetical protein
LRSCMTFATLSPLALLYLRTCTPLTDYQRQHERNSPNLRLSLAAASAINIAHRVTCIARGELHVD